MAKFPSRKTKYGFYKEPRREQFFTYLKLRDATEIDKMASEIRLGQATLTSWIVEEVLHDEHILKTLRARIEQRPELAEIRALAEQYANERTVQKGVQSRKVPSLRCSDCGHLSGDLHSAEYHKRRDCPKRPLEGVIQVVSRR